jgi:dTDP-4-dehydrorhamnose 3,5-epimerase-like enzyme
MKNVRIVELEHYYNADYGNLVPIEGDKGIPFSIERVYFIFSVPENARRGFHGHKKLNQALVCVAGEVTIHVDSGVQSREIVLNNPSQALLIGPMIWREMYNFSRDAVLLVLADRHFEESDYIRSYGEFLELSPHNEGQTHGE